MSTQATEDRILEVLEEDAQASYAEIADRANVSKPTVRKYINQLEEDGVIIGYSADIDPKKLEPDDCPGRARRRERTLRRGDAGDQGPRRGRGAVQLQWGPYADGGSARRGWRLAGRDYLRGTARDRRRHRGASLVPAGTVEVGRSTLVSAVAVRGTNVFPLAVVGRTSDADVRTRNDCRLAI